MTGWVKLPPCVVLLHRKGDMIVEVNGRRLTNTTLLDAYQLFRNLKPGTVELVVRRKDNLEVNKQTISSELPPLD